MAFWDKILAREKKEKPEQRTTASLSSNRADADAVKPTSEITRVQESHEKRAKGTGVLVAPHTTEKTADFINSGGYVFKVAHTANKQEVAAAVTGRYGVTVDRVHIVTQPSKERRRGRQIGWKHGFKKAMVQLKAGQAIETL